MAKLSLSCLLVWPLLVCSSSVRPLVVVGHSMAPTLQAGQLVLLHRDYYRGRLLGRGDVVVFRWKGHTYVKRVYALAGDRVTLVNNDGYQGMLDPSLAPKLLRLARHDPYLGFETLRVPTGHFFCLGDNQVASVDSRELGPIPVAAIVGRVQSLWGSQLAGGVNFSAQG